MNSKLSIIDYADLPSGPFRTVVADPPWNYSKKMSGGGTSGYSPVHHSRGGNRGAANHYGTLTLEQLWELPVEEVVADEAHLYMWTTGAFLVEAHELAIKWGFQPKGVIPWLKVKKNAVRHIEASGGDLHAALRMGMGRYLRWCSEYVLFGVKGKLPTLRNDVIGAFFAEPRTHSEKPDRFYEIVKAASPGPRLELFARTARDGFDSWGDELGSWKPRTRRRVAV